MAIYDNILETIGKTPLVRLNRITRGLSSTVCVKVEYLNPGGSVKDRIGLSMIEAAEQAGLLKPGGTIIEATAGNTGVGLALAAAIKGYRTIFVIPDKMSTDKIRLLEAYGAEVVITPTSVLPDSPESYNGVASRLVQKIPGAFRPDQFSNPNNPLAHYHSTGPEIWEDTEGRIDIFVAGMGTGGTISGTAKYLKEKNPAITVVGADPEGSILSGDSPKPYKVEGIGEDFIPSTFNRQVIDDMIRVSDRESFNMARRLAREEGLLVGGSAGTAVAAALKYAQRLTSPKLIVALMPDTGRNYLSRIYSDSWMKENGFWEEGEARVTRIREVLGRKREYSEILALKPCDLLSKAAELMLAFKISQLPVIDRGEIVGSIDETALMKLLKDGEDPDSQHIHKVMGKPLPAVDGETDISEVYRLFLSGISGLIVTVDGKPTGVIARSDLIEYLVESQNVMHVAK